MTPRAIAAWLTTSPLPMLVGRLLVGVVFVWYGWNKVAEPIAFLKALREYEMFPASPPHWMNLTVVVLPWIEIVCGLLLIAGAWLRGAGSLLLVMTVAFTVVIAMRAADEAAATGLGLCAVRFDCGCGTGIIAACSKLAENVVLCVLAAIVTLSRSRCMALESRWPRASRTI